MASAEEKQKNKEEAQKAKELREAGRVPRWRNFHLDSGRRVRTAWAWIPRLRLVVLASFAVSIVASIAAVMAVYNRPPAMIFMAMPDGSIACAPISTPAGEPLRRRPDQRAVCERLAPPVGLDVEAHTGRGE